MSITDELRKYANDLDKKAAMKSEHWFSPIGMRLERIADSIDAEHESAMAKQFKSLTVDMEPMTDENMAEGGWVRLPVDADGEVIHIGDRVENNERVARIVLTDGNCEPSVYVEKLPNVLHEYFCDAISHYHEPTVEEVLREFGDWYAHTKGGCDEDGIIAEYAARLRLAGDAE